MKKTEELRQKLIETFSNRRNWNRRIEIDGEMYIYISAVNEIRREVKQSSETIAQLLACFALFVGSGYDQIMWCC